MKKVSGSRLFFMLLASALLLSGFSISGIATASAQGGTAGTPPPPPKVPTPHPITKNSVMSPAPAYSSCAGTSAAGNNQGQSFFTDVLNDMGMPVNQFALDAFTRRGSSDPSEWEQYEGTGACWNPLATTLSSTIIGNGCTDTLYNSYNVRNYSSQWCGEQATAYTILHTTIHTSNDYWAIQDFLSGLSFNSDFTNSSSDAIYSELVEWVGSTGYANSLRNQWWTLWTTEGPGSGGGGGSAPSTPSSPNPSDGQTLGRTSNITLYWSTNGSSCDVSISGGPGTNINQTGVSCSSFFFGQQWPGSYQWHVTAHNSYGTTVGSTWHFGIQPYAPSNLNASTASQSQINLSWTKSSDDPGSVDSYNIYRNGSQIANVSAGSTSYQAGGLSCNSGYSFYVTAVRQGVESSASNTASANTSSCNVGNPPSTPSGPSPSDGQTLGRTTNIILYWSTDGTSCDLSLSGGPGININPTGLGCSEFDLAQQWPGSYQWSITAHNGYGTTAGPTWHFYVQPYAPSNLNASAASQTQANLSWAKSSDDPGSVDSYNIYENGANVANVGAGTTSYPAGGLACNTSYSFYVTAVRQGVESAPSNTASTITQGCSGGGGGSLQAAAVWTSDPNWNSKTTFFPGDPIQWVITVDNETGNSAPANLTYLVTDPNGTTIINGQFTETIDTGVWWWGLPDTVGSTTGTYTFTGSVTYQGSTTQFSTTYDVVCSTFCDVPPSYWAYSWVNRLYNDGVTGGCSVNPLNYCPDSNVTRDQMAVFLERGMHGSGFAPPTVSLSFGDTAGDFAQYWIEALKADGITSGCGSGLYCPSDPTTRAQMAVFLLKSEHGSTYTPPPATGTKFTDVPASYWAASWIEQLANEGITSGCGTNLYCPDSPVTRAQMAVFLVKTFNLP